MRTCGTCSLCCKLLDIPELDKPDQQWCRYCKPGHGCQVYQQRPQVCRDYQCSWLDGKMSDLWYPLRAKIVVDMVVAPLDQKEQLYLRFTVDPGYPGRWREEPYASDIRAAMRNGIRRKQWLTVIQINGKWILLTPDGEVTLDWRSTRSKGDRLQNLSWEPHALDAARFC